MELYELVILEEETDEVFAISLVEEPAIEANWVYFNRDSVSFATIDNDKRIIIAPVLIPDKKILRVDGGGKPYEVFFTAETIERLAQKFIEKGYQKNATLEHNENIDGKVSVVESWVSKDRNKDKSTIYFGNQFPAGTWFISWKVLDDQVWKDYVKSGIVKGASIEGIFEHKLVEAKKVLNFSQDSILNEIEEQEALILLKEIKAIIKKDNRYKSKQRVDMESFSDYGESVRNNAKRGIELNERNGNKCATPVGKVRAQQLAQGRPISAETIKRMYSYLSRAEVYYDQAESENDCAVISYLLWGGKSGKSWAKNKLRELGLLQEGEAQPSIATTYPGQAASGSVAKALMQEEGCPPATLDVKLNLENRQKAINEANYGPLNPNEANEDYWEAKAAQFGGNVEEAKKAICGNCSFFYRTPRILECIAKGLGEEVDPYDAIEAGEIGYCEAFDFKCAAARTCDAWVAGGPITEE